MSRIILTCAAGLLALAAAPCGAQSQSRGSAAPPPPPSRVTLSNGRTWERIQLQYTDAAYIASVLTGRPLGYGVIQGGPGYGGGFGGGYGGWGMPGYGMGGYGGMLGGYGRPTGLAGGAGGFGPGGFGGFGGAGGGFGGPGGFQNGGRGGLFPNLVIIADPSSNSLLVDP